MTKKVKIIEFLVRGALGLCALVTLVTTIGIVLVLSSETIPFFQEVSITDFLFGTRWTPLLEPKSFGVLPLVSGTGMIMLGSAFIALPIGITTAVYLSEFSSLKMRAIIKPVLEVLAGIPTIVYGYFALTFITPITYI